MLQPDREVEAPCSCPDQLGAIPQYLRAAGHGISAADLLRAPARGGFSLVEHACHLRDYEESGCLQRILRMLVEGSPMVEDFEGERIAVERSYRHQNFSAAVEDFAQRRETTLRILRLLSADDWRRTATVGTTGLISIRQLVEMVAAHDQTHRQEIESLLDEMRSDGQSWGSEDTQDVAALRAMALEFTEGFNTGDLARIMRFYGGRYVDVNLRAPVQTHEERRAYFSRILSQRGFRVQVNPDEIVVQGSVAFVRGRIEMVDRDNTVIRELRYLEISRKESDGWKAMWGMDGPVQELPGEEKS